MTIWMHTHCTFKVQVHFSVSCGFRKVRLLVRQGQKNGCGIIGLKKSLGKEFKDKEGEGLGRNPRSSFKKQ